MFKYIGQGDSGERCAPWTFCYFKFLVGYLLFYVLLKNFFTYMETSKLLKFLNPSLKSIALNLESIFVCGV
jgi:hypothetical protein